MITFLITLENDNRDAICALHDFKFLKESVLLETASLENFLSSRTNKSQQILNSATFTKCALKTNACQF